MFTKFRNHTKFNDVADILLNHTILCTKDQKFRLCEIEFYYRSDDHDDKYVHSKKDQMKFGRFYFHQYGNGVYKSGTYKGVDLTFGSKKRNVYYGVLVRSICNIETGEFIEGPCRSVNKILEINKAHDVKEFVKDKKVPLKLYDNKDLYIEHVDLDKEQIYIGPRVGLSDKYPEFKDMKYRYAIMIKKIRKQKKFTHSLI